MSLPWGVDEGRGNEESAIFAGRMDTFMETGGGRAAGAEAQSRQRASEEPQEAAPVHLSTEVNRAWRDEAGEARDGHWEGAEPHWGSGMLGYIPVARGE